jgi:hypothetical protein
MTTKTTYEAHAQPTEVASLRRLGRVGLWVELSRMAQDSGWSAMTACPYCKAPLDATGHCATEGCGNSSQPAADRDPLDDPEYQKFLEEQAKTCRARDKPCPACCAGGVCDGRLGGGRFEDEEADNGDAECDYDEED